jgi:hypothetical protein
MTPRAFCEPGTGEAAKLAVHGLMLAGAVLCCGYNLAAFLYRREVHNAINGLIYGALIALEVEHVKHHAE